MTCGAHMRVKTTTRIKRVDDDLRRQRRSRKVKEILHQWKVPQMHITPPLTLCLVWWKHTSRQLPVTCDVLLFGPAAGGGRIVRGESNETPYEQDAPSPSVLLRYGLCLTVYGGYK